MLLTSFLSSCQTCTDGILPARYDQGSCDTVLRTWGHGDFLLFRCGFSFTDILDTAEWDAGLAAGTILKSPTCGNFNLNTATTDQVGTDGCGNPIPDVSEHPFEFTTPNVMSDRTDEDWFADFYRNAKYYTMAPIDCEGGIALPDDLISAIKASLGLSGAAATGAAVPYTNPGFMFGLTSKPEFVSVNGAGKAGNWTFAGNFRAKDVIRYAEIPGVLDSIAANG